MRSPPECSPGCHHSEREFPPTEDGRRNLGVIAVTILVMSNVSAEVNVQRGEIDDLLVNGIDEGGEFLAVTIVYATQNSMNFVHGGQRCRFTPNADTG
ncbi:hypothetical protein MMC29_002297 [Sticta canariensis]|nr:hypothetical protein [Sticta canariensis]